MSIISVFLIGIGLSMDACAVSFAKGMEFKKNIGRNAFCLAFFFGVFQAIMPFFGWWIGTYFESFITVIDHWIAFILLGYIGFHMIKNAYKNGEDTVHCPALSLSSIFILAIATSIDAFAVGISFAFLQVDILSAVFLIGTTTFFISFTAFFIGNRIGGMLGKYAELLGGIILISIGVKILIDHLFF